MRNVVATAVAIVLGLVAVYLVHSYIKSRQAKETATVRVTVAAKEIPAGTRISQKLLAAKAIPRRALPPGYILADQYALILDKEILYTVKRSDPLLLSLFKPEEDRITGLIELGKRAVTLRVNQVSSVARQIRPGDYVDLFATIKTYRETPRVEKYAVILGKNTPSSVETMLLLTKLKILSIDYKTSREFLTGAQETQMMRYGTITVLATPQECEMLIFAQAFADLTCVLRNPLDTVHPKLPAVNMDIFKKMVEHSQKLRSND